MSVRKSSNVSPVSCTRLFKVRLSKVSLITPFAKLSSAFTMVFTSFQSFSDMIISSLNVYQSIVHWHVGSFFVSSVTVA